MISTRLTPNLDMILEQMEAAKGEPLSRHEKKRVENDLKKTVTHGQFFMSEIVKDQRIRRLEQRLVRSSIMIQTLLTAVEKLGLAPEELEKMYEEEQKNAQEDYRKAMEGEDLEENESPAKKQAREAAEGKVVKRLDEAPSPADRPQVESEQLDRSRLNG